MKAADPPLFWESGPLQASTQLQERKATPASPARSTKSIPEINKGKDAAARSLTPMFPLWRFWRWVMARKALKSGIWVLMKTLKSLPRLSVRWSTTREEEGPQNMAMLAPSSPRLEAFIICTKWINLLFKVHSLYGTLLLQPKANS